MKRRPGFNRGHSWCLSLMLLVPGILLAQTSSQDTERKIIKKVEVEYPATLKQRGIGGTVRLKVYIKADGSVRQTEVLGGSAVLADSAQKAVAHWRFTPAAAESVTEVSVVFNPKE
jgi:TonB family protein